MERRIREMVEAEDFAGVEHVVREAVRGGDADAKRVAAELLFEWVLERFATQPLARLGVLATHLGPLCAGPATALVRAVTKQKVPGEVWDQAWRVHTTADLDAILEAMTRCTQRDMAERVTAVHERYGDKADPRITSWFLRWFEAPPIRSTSSMPMWNEVFQFLFEQGDPRTLGAFPRLRENAFPSGKTMQGWIADRLEAEQNTWEAREDAERLRSMLQPGAEGDDHDLYESLALAVSGLTQLDFVGAGGDLVPPSFKSLLTPLEHATTPWDNKVAGIATAGHGGNNWKLVLSDAKNERTAASDGTYLVVFDATGQVLWSEDVTTPRVILGFNLSPSGRYLAFLEHTDQISVVDLDQRQVTTFQVPVPYPVEYKAASNIDCQTVLAFAPDESTIYSAHPIGLSPLTSPDKFLGIQVYRHDIASDRVEHTVALDWVEDQPGVHVVPQRANAQLMLSGTGQWMFVEFVHDTFGRSRNYQGRVGMTLERGGAAWHLRQAWEIGSSRSVTFRWDGESLRYDESARWGQGDWMQGTIEPATGFTAVTETGDRKAKRKAPLNPAVEHPHPIATAIACARQARTFAVGFGDAYEGIVRVYSDVGDAMGKPIKIPNSRPVAMAMSSDGRHLYVSSTKSIYWFQLDGLKKSKRTLKPKLFKGHKDPIRKLVMDDRRSRIVSLADDSVMVWSTTGERQLDLRHKNTPTSIATHPTADLMASADLRHVFVWDLTSGQSLADFALEEGTDRPSVAWTADGMRVLSTHGSAILECNPDNGEILTRYTHHTGIVSLVSAPEHGLVVFCDDEAGVHRLTGGDAIPLARLFAPAVELAIGRQGQVLASAGLHGHAGSCTLLFPSEVAGSVPEAPTTRSLDSSVRTEVNVLPDTRDRASELRLEAEANPRSTAVDPSTVQGLYKRLRRKKSRRKAIQEFVEVADAGLWTNTLARYDFATYYHAPGDPIFGLLEAEGQAYLGWLLQQAPQHIPIVDAYLQHLTTLYFPDGGLEPDVLRLPYVTRVHLRPGAGGSDLSGFPALATIIVDGHLRGHAMDDVIAMVESIELPSGAVPRLEFNVADATGAPNFTTLPYKDVYIGRAKQMQLPGLGSIQKLQIDITGEVDAALLSEATGIEELRINWTRELVSLNGLDLAIAGGARLRSLRIDNAPSLKSIDALRDAVHLKSFTVTRCKLTSLAGLARASKLRVIDVEDAESLSEIGPLTCASLEVFNAVETALTHVDDLVVAAASLREVRLKDCMALTSVAGLDGATSLRFLDLRNCSELERLPPLDTFRGLELVALAGTPFTPDDVSDWVRARATWTPNPHFELLMTQRIQEG